MRLTVDIRGPGRRWAGSLLARLSGRLQARESSAEWRRLVRRAAGARGGLETSPDGPGRGAIGDGENGE